VVRVHPPPPTPPAASNRLRRLLRLAGRRPL